MLKALDRRKSIEGENRIRISELDSLRGIAALSVVIYHYTSIYPRLISVRNLDFVPQVDLGYFGVEIFFIISGFVIFTTITSSPTIIDFFLSRFARIFPVYWLSVLIAVTLSAAVNKFSDLSTSNIVANMTMLQSLMGFRHLDEVYWTLTYELGFYMWIALAVYICRAINLRIEVPLLIWLLLATVIRAGDTNVAYRISLVLLLNYGQFFIIGIAFFLIYYKYDKPLTYVVLIWAMAISAFGANQNTPANGFRAYFWIALGCTLFFYWIVFFKPAAMKSSVLKYLGRISYSLYLVHASIGYFLLREFEQLGIPDLPAVLLAIAFAIVVAHVINILVEVPGQRLFRASFRRVQSCIFTGSRSA
ncbi:acyltransferase [Methylobacterium sp. WL18]|uniref:acyltransferase family protein n=1 Tax=Methylobacterium sp. WL18 TaxID=2603897 RepID=UPI0011CCB146|nr:acyltransferase [Methylobacterium sp. WL18]TXN73473.1 acyltransferase [Methylobacterium sp. WL18]